MTTLDEAVAQLAQSDAALREAVAPLKAAQWSWKPDAATWSIAEVAEHLVLVERGILFRLRSAPADGLEKTEGKEQVLGKLTQRAVKFPAPARLVPTGKYPAPVDFEIEMSTARAATLTWAQDADTHLQKHVMPHPAFGELHGLQWLLMMAQHTLRHIAQIREVMAHPQYPAADSGETTIVDIVRKNTALFDHFPHTEK